MDASAARSPFESVVREAFHGEGLDFPTPSSHRCCPLRTSLLATGRFLTVPQTVSETADERIFRRLPLSMPNTVKPFVTVKNRSLSPPAELFIDHARKLAAIVAK